MFASIFATISNPRQSSIVIDNLSLLPMTRCRIDKQSIRPPQLP